MWVAVYLFTMEQLLLSSRKDNRQRIASGHVAMNTWGNDKRVIGCTGRVCISVGANFYITQESHFYGDVQEFLVRTNELVIITREAR